jgi:hypothetical protein
MCIHFLFFLPTIDEGKQKPFTSSSHSNILFLYLIVKYSLKFEIAAKVHNIFISFFEKYFFFLREDRAC